MSKGEKAIINRLNSLYEDKRWHAELPLGGANKYAVFSDIHLGNGKGADNFYHNEKTMECALKHYEDNGYSLILLGDIEEFWQFDFVWIRDRYDESIYKFLRNFPADNVHRVHGNHDKEWGGLPDPIGKTNKHSHYAPEAVKLGKDIFLVHGHQGDLLSDKKAGKIRLLVRAFKIIEPIGKLLGCEKCAAPQSQIPKDREKVYYTWAKSKKIILICGHTHRAIFASRSYYTWLKEQIDLLKIKKKQNSANKAKRKKLSKEIKYKKKDLRVEKRRGRDINPLEENGKPLPCYFNTGCGLYRDGITNIEIEGDKIRLIKWQKIPPGTCDKSRDELWNEESLTELKKQIVSTLTLCD